LTCSSSAASIHQHGCRRRKIGVSKATIYKHWHDKDALALESLSLMFGLEEEPPRFDSGDLRQDLVDAPHLSARPERQEMKNRVMRA